MYLWIHNFFALLNHANQKVQTSCSCNKLPPKDCYEQRWKFFPLRTIVNLCCIHRHRIWDTCLDPHCISRKVSYIHGFSPMLYIHFLYPALVNCPSRVMKVGKWSAATHCPALPPFCVQLRTTLPPNSASGPVPPHPLSLSRSGPAPPSLPHSLHSVSGPVPSPSSALHPAPCHPSPPSLHICLACSAWPVLLEPCPAHHS